MKEMLIALCAILAVSTARVVITAEPEFPGLLGAKECTWGPSYWCENIATAAGCNATKHCISKVWEKMEVPEDNDTVCGVCKDMVQQARDQLESNQTQQDLKAVFEGSCKLIHVRPIVSECIKIVDQFIPELVETLASQMNPSVVCSVAGLCNSERIDKLLLEHQNAKLEGMKIKSISLDKDELEPNECSKCYTIATHMEHKLNGMSRDQMLEHMLNVCGDLSSFSDACSSIILTNFNTIYSHLQQNFNAENICHLSGQCADKFHKHEDTSLKPIDVEVRPLSSIGMVDVGDDLPCKLCEQLVGHLKDLLVANTTEEEFHLVLQGLCKQTKSFATECKAVVDEYYPEIYSYLTDKLNGNIICQISGICPSPGKPIYDGPISPLVPPEAKEIGVRIMNEKRKAEKEADVKIGDKRQTSEAEEMQLPLERMHIPFDTSVRTDVKGKEACALCEYVLHYIQETLTDPVTEDKVKGALGKVCRKLPSSIENNCQQFIDTYGDAVVAILVQEIDPSQVCPMIHVCPSEELISAWESIPKKFTIEVKEVKEVKKVEEKPSCPLCLLAVTQIYEVIKNNKTEANIVAELDKLCTHLPHSLTDECVDLVKNYSKELVEMLLADLTPQEVCTYIKLCDPTKNPGPSNTFLTDENGEILTNEIPDFPLSPAPTTKVNVDATCIICEFVMEHIDKAMSNKKTRDKIEHIVYEVCDYLPKTVSKECTNFVGQYGEVVIDILSQEISPKEVCSMIGLCKINLKQIEESVAECALCQTVISTIDKLLDNRQIDEDIEEAVSKVCKYVSASIQNKCTMMVEIYGQSIINIIKAHGDSKSICTKIALCTDHDYYVMSMKTARKKRSATMNLGRRRCTWGPSYWCSTDETAVECKAVEHCRTKVWKANSAAEALKQI